jgi:hypothetical protein
MDLEETVARNDCAGEVSSSLTDRQITEQFIRDKPILSSGRMLHKDYDTTAKVQQQQQQ